MTMRKPFAITLDVGSSLANRTGSWRSERPQYVHRLPPCNEHCPAGEDIQGWLQHAEGGDYEAAWRHLVRDNPLPGVMGRVCYHACESACNRARLDEAVGINAVERFLGDEAIRRGWALPAAGADTGRRVLVVGSGPSGLSAAYHLRRRGHAVTVLEAASRPGGMMRWGIPRYRLPREVLDAEIARLVALGVELRCGERVGSVEPAMAGFDAAFLAIGAQQARRAWMPAVDARRVLDAVSVLHAVEEGEPPRLGRRVVVVGGGNTALDVARSARRLGATEAVILYRRTRAQMPAHDGELREALEEGVVVRWLSTVQATGADGTLVVEKMRLDETGHAVPTGEFETLAADSLVLALGQASDLSCVEGLAGVAIGDGTLQVDPLTMMTGRPGLFAGGDLVPAERNVTVAIGHGRRAAAAIDAWLQGRTVAPPPEPARATFERLNPWYYSDAPRTVRPQLDAARRTSSFDEVQGGLDDGNALFEARRCLSCGNCFGCDNCYGVCPDNAVRKERDPARAATVPYAFDLDFCKGCGLCAAECPCGAIDMVPEPD